MNETMREEVDFEEWLRFDDRPADDRAAGPARKVEVKGRCRGCWGPAVGAEDGHDRWTRIQCCICGRALNGEDAEHEAEGTRGSAWRRLEPARSRRRTCSGAPVPSAEHRAKRSPPVPWMDGRMLPAAEPPASNGHLPAPGPGSVPAMPQLSGHGRSAESGQEDEDDLQRCEDVVADCTEAIRHSPRDPRLYLERGDARSWLGRLEEAVADRDRAVALDPATVSACLRRCQANSELGRDEAALADYERLVSLDQDAVGEVGELSHV